MKRVMRLRGVSGVIKGQVWEHPNLIRVGRLPQFELMLDDPSVSRRHAEVVRRSADADIPENWLVRDLASTNGTYINGARVPAGDHVLQPRDIVQFGKVAFLVEVTDATPEGPPSDSMVQAATIGAGFNEGVRRVAYGRDQMPRAGEQLLALLRAGHHLVYLETEDQLLDSILNDAVSVLDAQRGAIVLGDCTDNAEEPTLKLRSLVVGGSGDAKGRFHFSKRLTNRCFANGESALYRSVHDEKDLMTQSISDGAMSSILCVLLRTPRRKLGVLHLDRGFLQEPFTEDDLMLADALAANVSAGIECAQLLRKQKELFENTIMVLGEMVELRDEYTGGHTKRVTTYATALAKHMELTNEELEWIRIGTPLHDIGKVGISDEILRKPGKLTAQEFAVMQTHTIIGAEYLSTIPELIPCIPIVRSHHERWDGTGYPDRKEKADIPLLARIVSVADAFDAMTSSRPYHVGRRGRTPEEAFAEVEAQSGRQFDPACARAFLEIREEITRIMYELMPNLSQRRPPSSEGSPTSHG